MSIVIRTKNYQAECDKRFVLGMESSPTSAALLCISVSTQDSGVLKICSHIEQLMFTVCFQLTDEMQLITASFLTYFS